MKTAELILQQVCFLRQCFSEFSEASAEFASAKNKYEVKDAEAGARIYSGGQIFNDLDEEIKLTNDIARKAYIKDHALNESQLLNTAKEQKDTADKRVEVEISVLSALKQIAINETFDDGLLAKYDLLTDEEAGI